MVGDALGVVAGRRGDDALRPLGRGELRQEVAGAALLERAGELEVLELQPHVGAGDGRERLGRARSGVSRDRAPDRVGRRLHVGEGHGQVHGRHLRTRVAPVGTRVRCHLG